MPWESQVFRVNNNLCNFSPDGRFIAIGCQCDITVKDVKNLETFHTYTFDDVLESLEWSPDSEYIFCANITRAVVQVFSVCYPEWKWKLQEGSNGLEAVTWAPDSKHLLTVGDFYVQMTVWSLEDKSYTFLQNLKSSATKHYDFSPNGEKLALIINEDGEDRVAIYNTKKWIIRSKLICERLHSIDDISWSPNGELLAIWCSIIGMTKMVIYSTATDSHVGVFCPEESASLLSNNKLLGIEIVRWFPSGQLLAVSGYSEMVVLLNFVTWKPISQLNLDPVIKENNYMTKVYRENVTVTSESTRSSVMNEKYTLDEDNSRPVNIPIAKQDICNEPIIAKVSILEFSTCGRYLAVLHQLYPTTLWIWDIIGDSIDYVLLQNKISGIQWDPLRCRLMIFSETQRIVQWTPEKATLLTNSRGITVLNSQWHQQGKMLVLYGYQKSIVYKFD